MTNTSTKKDDNFQRQKLQPKPLPLCSDTTEEGRVDNIYV